MIQAPLQSLFFAFFKLLHPRFLMLLITPLVLSFFLITTIFITWLFSGLSQKWSLWLYESGAHVVFSWIEPFLQLDALFWLNLIVVLFVVFLGFPLGFIIMVVLTSSLLSPFAIQWLLKSDFQDIKLKKGGSFWWSLWNNLFASTLAILALILTLPLWLIPGGALALPLIILAWLNKKVFIYDSLQDAASQEENHQVQNRLQKSAWVLGFILAGLTYIPVLGFIMPFVASLAYAHLTLTELRRMRNEKDTIDVQYTRLKL